MDLVSVQTLATHEHGHTSAAIQYTVNITNYCQSRFYHTATFRRRKRYSNTQCVRSSDGVSVSESKGGKHESKTYGSITRCS